MPSKPTLARLDWVYYVLGRARPGSKAFEYIDLTPNNSEIICGQNVGTKVVCGIILFFEKKAMPKI